MKKVQLLRWSLLAILLTISTSAFSFTGMIGYLSKAEVAAWTCPSTVPLKSLNECKALNPADDQCVLTIMGPCETMTRVTQDRDEAGNLREVFYADYKKLLANVAAAASVEGLANAPFSIRVPKKTEVNRPLLFANTYGTEAIEAGYTLPIVSGTVGQILKVTSAGTVTFADAPVVFSNKIVDSSSPTDTFVDVDPNGLGTLDQTIFTNAGVQSMVITASNTVGIGTATPEGSAILDLVSTTKALKIPAMTQTQIDAIVSPKKGMQVINTTTNKLNFYNGIGWEPAGISEGLNTIGVLNTVAPSTAVTPLPADANGAVYKKNDFYIVSAAVGTSGKGTVALTPGPGNTSVGTGDYLIYDGANWSKVAFSDVGQILRHGDTKDSGLMVWDQDNQNVAKFVDGLFAGVNGLNIGGAAGSGSIKFFDTDKSNSITFGLPADVTATYSLTLPSVGPALNQVLVSDASGNLSWAPLATPASEATRSCTILNNGTVASVESACPFTPTRTSKGKVSLIVTAFKTATIPRCTVSSINNDGIDYNCVIDGAITRTNTDVGVKCLDNNQQHSLNDVAFSIICHGEI